MPETDFINRNLKKYYEYLQIIKLKITIIKITNKTSKQTNNNDLFETDWGTKDSYYMQWIIWTALYGLHNRKFGASEETPAVLYIYKKTGKCAVCGCVLFI